MKMRSVLTIIALILLAPMFTRAGDINYDYVQLSYVDESIDDGPSGDGFGVGLSVKVLPCAYIYGGYMNIRFDSFGGYSTFDGDAFKLGFGWFAALGERADAIARVAYVDARIDTHGRTFSDDGVEVIAGIRGMVADRLELNVFVSFVDLNDSGGNTAFQVGMIQNLTDRFGIGAAYTIDDDSEILTAGIRYSWRN